MWSVLPTFSRNSPPAKITTFTVIKFCGLLYNIYVLWAKIFVADGNVISIPHHWKFSTCNYSRGVNEMNNKFTDRLCNFKSTSSFQKSAPKSQFMNVYFAEPISDFYRLHKTWNIIEITSASLRQIYHTRPMFPKLTGFRTASHTFWCFLAGLYYGITIALVSSATAMNVFTLNIHHKGVRGIEVSNSVKKVFFGFIAKILFIELDLPVPPPEPGMVSTM